MVDNPPQFGELAREQIYVDRPGAYGVAIGEQDLSLAVSVEHLLALPGGGLERDETPEEGLLREFREETGHRVGILRHLGRANQYVYARKEKIYYNKICRFYQVKLIGKQRPAVECDHQLRWISAEEAIASLTEESHRWAVLKAVER